MRIALFLQCLTAVAAAKFILRASFPQLRPQQYDQTALWLLYHCTGKKQGGVVFFISHVEKLAPLVRET